MATGCFLGLELLLRIKLGAIYVMAAAWVLAHQRLAARLGPDGADQDQAHELLFALYSALVICAIIFVVFGGLNIMMRTINADWRWFQLP